jgi:hypothetical protein
MNQIKKAYKKKYGDVSENMLGIFSDGWKIGRSELEAENAKLREALEGLIGHYYDVPDCWCECCEAIRKANSILDTAKGE